MGSEALAAFVPASKSAVKALKITKGKSFNSGVVFIDGRYIPSPYVVERYGNVIRINGIQVTQPVIEWAEFLKTQPKASVVQTAVEPEESSPSVEPAAPAAATAVVAEPVAVKPAPAFKPAAEGSGDSDDDPLADLFEDEPAKPEVAPVQAETPPPPPPPAPSAKPSIVTTVMIEGEFVPNDLSQELLGKINALRTEIDASLRRGGFICFGSAYSRVSGDSRLALGILERLPPIMKSYNDPKSFAEAVRNAGFVYFPPKLVNDLYANRQCYLLLRRRWKRLQDDVE